MMHPRGSINRTSWIPISRGVAHCRREHSRCTKSFDLTRLGENWTAVLIQWCFSCHSFVRFRTVQNFPIRKKLLSFSQHKRTGRFTSVHAPFALSTLCRVTNYSRSLISTQGKGTGVRAFYLFFFFYNRKERVTLQEQTGQGFVLEISNKQI